MTWALVLIVVSGYGGTAIEVIPIKGTESVCLEAKKELEALSPHNSSVRAACIKTQE